MTDVIDLDAPAAQAAQAVGKITTHADGSKTLVLDYPVTLTTKVQGALPQEDKITQLTFRRMNGADLRAIGNLKNEGDMIALIFQRLCNITPPVFDRLDAVDIAAATEVLADFFPKSLRPGGPTSAP